MCVGLVKKIKFFILRQRDWKSYYLCWPKTGRDGIHGATWHQLNLMTLH